MKILYVANHNYLRGCPHENDDEGAIAYVLKEMGHSVILKEEVDTKDLKKVKADVMLFHHWDNPEVVATFKGPKVFWYFDLVDYPRDSSLAVRCAFRKKWMKDMTEVVDLGFCTDGDWVKRDTSGKLRHLNQGFDERLMNVAEVTTGKLNTRMRSPILFTGVVNSGGVLRKNFVDQMRLKYRKKFSVIERGVYREDMARVLRDSVITVAPLHPITDLYWSNRVYNTIGLGGFLIHPYVAKLAEQYKEDEEIVFYRSMHDLHLKIRWFLRASEAKERARITLNGMNRTLEEHTYRHRVASMVQQIKDHLNV